MTRFRIAQAPTFDAHVDIPRVNEAVITVPFTFKYRDRSELATLFDRWQSALMDDQQRLQEAGDSVSLSDITELQITRQTEQIGEIVVAWGFDDPLNTQSIRALVDTCAGAADAIIDAYQKAYATARLGN
jgi:hypothetical protein